MRKLLIITALLAGMAMQTAAPAAAQKVVRGGKSAGIGAVSAVDSASYYMGVHIARTMKQQISTLNGNMLLKGIGDAFDGKTDITIDSASNFLNDYFTVRLPKIKEAEEKVYLESVEKNHLGVRKTASGLLYEIVAEGDTSLKPTDADDVVVTYVGRFREGATHDAKKQGAEFDRQSEVSLPMTNMIPGWTEGLKLLGKGGKIRMWIPSELGYGAGNMMYGGPVGSFETLIFDVEMLDVHPGTLDEDEPEEEDGYEGEEDNGSYTVN